MAHIAKHAMRGLSHEDRDTGVIFGFLGAILTLHKRFDYDARFLFAWDSPRSLRRNIFPAYKRRRRMTRDARSDEEREYDASSRRQMTLLRKYVLPEMGFNNQWRLDGLESDDVMALLLSKARGEIALVTTDHDLFQCLGTGVVIYNPITKRTITASDFKKEWGIEPHMWAQVLSLAGCATDEVPGVQNVGAKTAIKYLKGELRGNGMLANRIRASAEDIALNAKLVTLPFDCEEWPASVFADIAELAEDTPDMGGAEAIFEEYGFTSFLREPMRDRWVRLLIF
jgi:DNA polymerase-1